MNDNQHTNQDIVDRLAELGGVMFPLRTGLKKPAVRRWQRAAPMTADQAVRELDAARNLAVNLAATGWIVIDTETAAGTAAMVALGYKPWSYPAKSMAGPTLADGSPNTKCGGAHFVFKVPKHWGNAWGLPTNRLGFKVAGGDGEHDKFDVLAGVRFLVAPPSMLSVANGAAYTPGEGFFEDIPEAPEWLRDVAVPCPSPALAAAHGCMVPDPPHVREAREATDLDVALDEIADAEWFAGYEHLVFPNGDEDEDGCPIYSWRNASHEKAGTSHACSHGRMFKFWGETMPGELGFEPQSAVTHLNLRAALRGVPVADVLREMGINAGNGDCTTEALGLPPLTPVAVDDAASLAVFEARAAASRAIGDATGAYHWAQRASLCTLALRARNTFNERQRAAAVEAGEVFIEPATVVGMAALTAEQVESVTAPLPEGASAFHAITLPAVAPRPVQQNPGPYPLHVLPPALRDMGESMVTFMAAPSQLVGPALLSTLAAACGPAITLVRPLWVEPGAVWCGVAAPPGTKKTPVLKLAHDPLAEAEKLIAAELEGARRAAELRARAALAAAEEADQDAEEEEKARLTGNRRKAKKDGPSTGAAMGIAAADGAPAIANVSGSGWTPPAQMTADPIERAVQLRQLANEAIDAVPPKIRLKLGDTTPEKLQDMLAEQGGRGYMVIGEGGRMLDAATRGDAGRVDTSFYLSARDEEDIIVQRIKRGEVVCRRPSMCLLMMMQPEVLDRALKGRDGAKTAIDANGFIDRFLLAYGDPIPDTLAQEGEIADGVVDAYNALIIREFVRSYRIFTKRLKFELSEDGRVTFGMIYDYIEAVVHSGCGVRATMWAKAAGNVVRIARLFAQVEVEDLDADVIHPIEAHHFMAAWTIVYWHLCSYGAGAGTPAAVPVDQLIAEAEAFIKDQLAKHGPMTRRKLRDNGAKHRAVLDHTLAKLVEEKVIELRDKEYRLL
ncbi:DUF3987 domain-containing protein [Mycolicibacterium fortuitum]|uniref:DUF3987 domain-containing protein n=1 Tax=Mycolicibacterium fortuitum TaxID=1766 RepID=UPI0007EB9440|nr:DUF3987 domain-containing protein [Mycolicibacterium fortuitum]OBB53127.1 hypothetical protein A5754_21605 [Mycolicibacterium fortuitum]OBB74841.1 hypothetical protein A5755_14230 [Mycolicibacterium fortuitum]OBF84972.1 hypothetical protein A5751_10615 [Mycolicibacterium fortuitum]